MKYLFIKRHSWADVFVLGTSSYLLITDRTVVALIILFVGAALVGAAEAYYKVSRPQEQ